MQGKIGFLLKMTKIKMLGKIEKLLNGDNKFFRIRILDPII